jgi:hypothetical protein
MLASAASDNAAPEANSLRPAHLGEDRSAAWRLLVDRGAPEESSRRQWRVRARSRMFVIEREREHDMSTSTIETG